MSDDIFQIFYPDLIDKSKTPEYTVVKFYVVLFSS